MSDKEKENFDAWYEDIEGIQDKGILIVKNGLEYQIALTIAKKPKFKKQTSKPFPKQRPKYEVKGVELLNIKTANQKEIDAIIDEDPSQQTKYENIDNNMIFDTTYMLKLTEQQYKSMALFMQLNDIALKQPFFFRRYGKKFSTHLKFSTESQIKITKQKKLKEQK